MAIATVSVGTESESTTQTIECPAPASIVDDNYLRIQASCTDNITISVNESGWTTVKHITMSVGLDGALAVFIKKASSESGTYTVDISGGVDRSLSVQCSQFSGLDLTTPEDAAATSTTDQNTTNYDPAAITTVTDDAYVETIVFGRASGISLPSVPSGYTIYGADKNANSYMGAAHIDSGSLGSEDPGTWGTFGSAADCMGITWAMRPATSGGVSLLQAQNYQGMNRLNGGFRS